MANRELEKDDRKHINETHPNPHGEQKVAEMPIQTDHRTATPENIAQNTSTTENRMNPSVAGALEDPSSDSMFNNADPQTKELLEKNTTQDRPPAQNRSPRRRNTA
jgi:hypothetical protein